MIEGQNLARNNADHIRKGQLNYQLSIYLFIFSVLHGSALRTDWESPY